MESNIKEHYNSDNLTQRIEAALIKAGKPLSNLELKEFTPIDQLHTGGARATMGLFKKAGLKSNALILDAGCGTGGSSRLLAHKFQCRVTGVDLADRFIDAAHFMTKCTGLEESVSFQQGSILELPFEDNSFNAVLCQHILMNIKDKSKAVQEFSRVLQPGGKLMLHEITQGENNKVAFPVPWAGTSEISFLEPWEILSEIFENHGFKIHDYSDETSAAHAWWEKAKAVMPQKAVDPDSLGPGLIFGENAKLFPKTMYSNINNNAIRVVEAVFIRKSV